MSTTYIVLKLADAENDYWETIGRSTAPSPNGAIRSITGVPGYASEVIDGSYVAVPERSWKPVTVKAVQQVVLKLESAGG